MDVQPHAAAIDGITFSHLMLAWRRDGVRITTGAIAAGAVALGLTYLVAPTFTASTTFLPPQQAQSTAASALASLGSLASLAGGAAIKSPGEQYVSIMQSVTVADRIIDRFELMPVYKAEFRVDARGALSDRVRISMGKKDGLITVEVEDVVPARAARMANQYVEELRSITSSLALSEAQQRRAFFEQQLTRTRDRLAAAQTVLQNSGFDPGALKAEPKAAAETYARLKAEVTAAELRLVALRNSLSDSTPEVAQQASVLSVLRARLLQAEHATEADSGSGYVGKYREFKYQEALFEAYARQFELARVDESRDGALIQVIDTATPPERKSKPKRAMTALLVIMAAGLILMAWSVSRQVRQQRNATA